MYVYVFKHNSQEQYNTFNKRQLINDYIICVGTDSVFT